MAGRSRIPPTDVSLDRHANRIGQPIVIFDPAQPWTSQEVTKVAPASQPAGTWFYPTDWSPDGRRLAGLLQGVGGVSTAPAAVR